VLSKELSDVAFTSVVILAKTDPDVKEESGGPAYSGLGEILTPNKVVFSSIAKAPEDEIPLTESEEEVKAAEVPPPMLPEALTI